MNYIRVVKVTIKFLCAFWRGGQLTHVFSVTRRYSDVIHSLTEFPDVTLVTDDGGGQGSEQKGKQGGWMRY